MSAKTPLHIGYKRVSSSDQSTDRQLAGIDLSLVYEDKQSGKDVSRPALQELLNDQNLSKLHEVTLHIHSLDRLARNLQDLQRLVDQFTAKGWTVVFQKEQWRFSGANADPMEKLMLQMFGAFAEFERNLIRERQSEGIAIAKSRGAYKGRSASLNASQIENLKTRAKTGATKSALAAEFGISRSSVYSYLNQ